MQEVPTNMWSFLAQLGSILVPVLVAVLAEFSLFFQTADTGKELLRAIVSDAKRCHTSQQFSECILSADGVWQQFLPTAGPAFM